MSQISRKSTLLAETQRNLGSRFNLFTGLKFYIYTINIALNGGNVPEESANW